MPALRRGLGSVRQGRGGGRGEGDGPPLPRPNPLDPRPPPRLRRGHASRRRRGGGGGGVRADRDAAAGRTVRLPMIGEAAFTCYENQMAKPPASPQSPESWAKLLVSLSLAAMITSGAGLVD